MPNGWAEQGDVSLMSWTGSGRKLSRQVTSRRDGTFCLDGEVGGRMYNEMDGSESPHLVLAVVLEAWAAGLGGSVFALVPGLLNRLRGANDKLAGAGSSSSSSKASNHSSSSSS